MRVSELDAVVRLLGAVAAGAIGWDLARASEWWFAKRRRR